MKALQENVVCDEEELDRSVSFYIYLAGETELSQDCLLHWPE